MNPLEEATKKINESANTSNEKEPELKEAYIQKHTNGSLSEAVIVAGLPYFLQISADGKARLLERIETPSMALLPLDSTSYLNRAYEFTNAEEINRYIELASAETLDSIFNKVLEIATKYIDADNHHLTILAADTVFTYFQDKIGQTHYLMFVGDNGTGKSNNLTVLSYLGYRPLYDTSVTPANIYSYLGSIEEGQGIILEDEADNIDSNLEKMKIYKVGYNAGKKVSRLDLSFGRKQQSYWTYCFKAYTAEKEPDRDRAKGFLERTFIIHCAPGNPQYDISEVINPAGDRKYETLLAELVDTRKLMLVYRLLHYKEPLPDIELTVRNREKQLCKPVLRLFQNSECRRAIGETLAKLLAEKRELKSNTLESKLYRIIRQLVEANGPALTNTLIHTTVKEELGGEDIQGKSQSFYSTEHGQLSLRQILGVLRDKFGAQPKHDGKSRLLVFNQDRLERLRTAYELAESIDILEPNGTNGFNGSGGKQAVLLDTETAQEGDNSQESTAIEPESNQEKTKIEQKTNGESNTSSNKALEPLEVLVPCPYCAKGFETEQEIINHGISSHPNKPIVAELEARRVIA